MNSKDIQLNRKRKIKESDDYNEKKSRNETNGSLPESDLWVDKYRPQTSKQIIGQQGDKSCVNKLIKWLSNWHKNLDKKPSFTKFGSDEGQGYRAALLSGAPGVGKTTTAHLVCKEQGYDVIELNASDVRSKKSLDQVVKELLGNTSLSSYFSGQKSGVTSKHVVIMDEVDGMAGTEDRGGIGELIQLIKSSLVPIICICNDRSHIKMRSLVNYCFDLRFSRPRIEQIKGPMMSIAYKEGVRIAPNVLHELIMSSNQDIRQVLHNLSILSTGGKRIDNLQSNQSIKDVKLGPFDAVRKVFTAGEDYAKMSFQDKSDLFFSDYSIMPLFNYENYCHVNPSKAKTETQKLKLAMKSIESMAFGDLIDKQIRTTNNWSLLPLQSAFASVMPGAYMNGHLGSQISFPSFMGRLSTTNKRNRLLQELKMHMNLKITGSKTALNLDYLEPLRDAIIEPLIADGTGGVPTCIEKLENYCLRREDIESIIELTLWNNQTDPMSRVDSKVKAALTRAYNKEGFCLPYSLGTVTKGKKGKSNNDLNDLIEGEEGINEDMTGEEAEDNDDIASDAMIKAKKKKANKKVTEKETKTNKSKTSVTQKEEKKKTKKVVKNDSESDVETVPKKVVKKETKSVKTNDNSSKKKSKTLTKTEEKTNGFKESPQKTPKKDVKKERSEPKVESKKTSKNETKKTVKKEPKSPAKEESSEKSSKSKSELKSETKSKKTPEKRKTESNTNSNSGSKGKQLTLNSFFKRK